MALDIIQCPHCLVEVARKADGTCPACGRDVVGVERLQVVEGDAEDKADIGELEQLQIVEGDVKDKVDNGESEPKPHWIMPKDGKSTWYYTTLDGRVCEVRTSRQVPRVAYGRGVSLVVSLFLCVLSFSFSDSSDMMWLLGFFFLAVAVFFFWFSFVDAINVRSAAEILRSDDRDPVIYLRRFPADLRYDDHGLGRTNETLFLFGWLGLAQASVETKLRYCFESAGPFVAIANPRDRVPKDGISRLHVPDEYWTVVVGDLMSRSQAVIFRATEIPPTSGIERELEEALRRVDPRRLIFLLLFGAFGRRHYRYDEFVASAQKYFKKPFPNDLRDGVLIYFDEDENAYLLEPKGKVAVPDHPLKTLLPKCASSFPPGGSLAFQFIFVLVLVLSVLFLIVLLSL